MEYQDEVERMRARQQQRRRSQAETERQAELEIIDFDELERRRSSRRSSDGRAGGKDGQEAGEPVHYARDQRSEDIVRQVRARRSKSMTYQRESQGPEPMMGQNRNRGSEIVGRQSRNQGPEPVIRQSGSQSSESMNRQRRPQSPELMIGQDRSQSPGYQAQHGRGQEAEYTARQNRNQSAGSMAPQGKGRKQESVVRQAVEEKRKKEGKKKRRGILFGLLLLCMLLGGGFFYFRGNAGNKYWTVAVFGVDSRDGGVGKDNHADVEMICVLNRETGEIRIVSVYRDTYLQVSEEGKYHKINQAYFDGGYKQAVKALERNLDLKIDDYATFNWKAVADAITILGGIDLEISESEFQYINGFITETVNSTGLGSYQLEHPGMQHLDGVQSVAYARLRLMDTDYNRTARQRLVLSLAMEKAKQADIGTLTTVLNTVLPQIATSVGLNDLLPLAKNVKKFHVGENGGFPFSRGETYIGKKDCVIPLTLESNVIQLHQFLYEDMEYQPSSTVKAISARIAEDSGMGQVAENAPEAKVGGSSSSGTGQSQTPETQAPAAEVPAETEETAPEESSSEETSDSAEESGDSAGPEDSGESSAEPSQAGTGTETGGNGPSGPGGGAGSGQSESSADFPQRPLGPTEYVEPAGPGNPGA